MILNDFQCPSSVVLPAPGLHCQQALPKTRTAEDWGIYLRLLSQPGKVQRVWAEAEGRS